MALGRWPAPEEGAVPMSEPAPDLTGSAVPSLRALILAQSALETGIPVLLFTAGSLDPADPPPAAARAELVAETAAALGLDVDDLELFSSDGYLLQATLGERLLRDSATKADRP